MGEHDSQSHAPNLDALRQQIDSCRQAIAESHLILARVQAVIDKVQSSPHPEPPKERTVGEKP
jgi:hypothetical protein